MPDEILEITTTAGTVQAEILRGLLEAQGIEVVLRRESAGAAYGFAVGPLGEVAICVRTTDEAAARALLDAYYAGSLDDSS
ncbi:MAG: DUF2007 domain-containing protein [Anaerolineales bacterium]